MTLDPLTSLLICPKNDVESREILKIAESFDIPTIVSEQPHGATLDAELDLIGRIRVTSPIAHDVVIVEMPSPATEDRLRELGFEVHIVDHHRYEACDRMRPESSLEQFLTLFGIDDTALSMMGFDPILVRGVAMIDRGFVWELTKMNVPEADRKRILTYYREQRGRLGATRRDEDAEAKKAWKAKRLDGDVIIVESPVSDLSIREAVSFLVAQEYSRPPVVLIYQSNRVVYLQDTDTAPVLQRTFGGFTFGQDKCWGRPLKDGELPSIEEILAAHRLALMTR